MSESNSCPSYFQMGYCLRGNDCPFAHDEHAVNVPEMEFFFGWELADSFVQQCKLFFLILVQCKMIVVSDLFV